VDNRLEASGEEGGSIYSKEPTFYSGDFASPEQMIPPNGVTDEEGGSIPWEACITLNNNWGYAGADRTYKSARMVIRKLVECVSKNGNLLLNVGPNARGEIPEESLRILEEVGQWMRSNGNSIYGCGQANVPKPEWGRFTQKGNRLYAHIFEESVGAIHLAGLAGKVKQARLVADGSELFLSRPWNVSQYPHDAFFNFAKPEHATYPLPDEKDTVVELELL
jgi:alpha-L-fucosidase